MDKPTEFGPAPPSYNEATAPPCQTVQTTQVQPPQPHPQEQHEPLLQQPYPQLNQPDPYIPPVKQQPYPEPQPTYPPQQLPYPQAQQPYPPQPSPVPQSMVIHMPPECHGPVSFGMGSVHMVCPNCHNQITTNVASECKEGDGCKVENHLACIIMFIIGCFILVTWFCSCLPYVFNKDKSSSTYRHSCPRCNVLLGTFVN